MSRKPDATGTSDREMVIERLFDAPRELVFAAWTDPKHLARWWGPRGFTHTTKQADIREGGSWVFTMHGPDGRDYPNRITFLEIKAPGLLRYVHGDPNDENFRTTVSFEDKGGKTLVTMRALFPTASAREHVIRTFKADEGGRQHLEKCAEQVERMRPGKGMFQMTRVVAAPREMVFRAWTEASELKKWFGPKGFTMPVCTNDLRPGGVMHYGLRSPDGMEIWGKWLWREITPPRRIVMLSGFSDPAAAWARHPMAPTWPMTLLSTVTFDDEGGKTKITLEWCPYEANAEERAAFDSAHPSMVGGWTGTFENLDAYIAKEAR